MSWLALLLIGVAVGDLTHSARPVPALPAVLGAASVIAVGLLAGLDGGRDVVALVVLAGVAVAWAQTVTWAFGRGHPAVPLVVLGVAVLATIMAAPAAGTAGGLLGDWLARDPLPDLGGLSADRALLLAGAFGLQLSSGNVIVRLVLAVTGTLNPVQHGGDADPETRLKGGRLLGPMERVFLLGLGLAGQLTAASIVIAAKGLLRFPELQSRSEQFRIHQLTEYFLVGSFMSWLVALGSLVLVHRA